MDQRNEATLQDYFGKMSDFLLKGELSDPKTQPQATQLARVWTLTTLRQVDPNRKGILLRFLYDSNLIGKYTPPTTKEGQPTTIDPIIDLTDADFSDVTFSTNKAVLLSGAVLSGANFVDADLIGVDLSRVNLSGANLGGADLSDAKLIGTNFINADLSGATLKGATDFDSSGVESLQGTTMPDGTIHP